MIEQKRQLVTEIPGPESQARHERKMALVADGVGSMLPVYVDRGRWRDPARRRRQQLIDLGSGIAVTTVGNSAPAVVPASPSRSTAFTHTCFMVAPYDGYVDVCAELADLTPGDHAKKAALFNSGAEAVENAVKIARVATGRDAVAVVDHAYHGRTNLTMAMTAKNMPYKQGFGPFAGEVYRAPMSYPFRDGLSGKQAAARAIDYLDKQVGAGNLACIAIEPVLGEGGFIVPAPGYLAGARGWCTRERHRVRRRRDPVRHVPTGDWFASEHEGVVPDLVTIAKGVAGGLPLAAVAGRAELMDSVHVGGLGGTYGGNPVACAAALGAIEEMRTHDLRGRARCDRRHLTRRLETLRAEHDVIAEVRGRGAMMAIELSRRARPSLTPPAPRRSTPRCHRAGVVTLTCGTWGNVFRFLPPLVDRRRPARRGVRRGGGGVRRHRLMRTPARYDCDAWAGERRDVVVLGSTGSIGTQALDIVRATPTGSGSSG